MRSKTVIERAPIARALADAAPPCVPFEALVTARSGRPPLAIDISQGVGKKVRVSDDFDPRPSA